MRRSRPLVAVIASLALVPGLVAVGALAAPTAGAPVATATSASLLRPADGVPRATITRTSHDIPHIVAKDYSSLGYGEGYATAQTSICTLADTVMTARGQRSRWLGPGTRYDDQVTLDATNLQTDALVHRHRATARSSTSCWPTRRPDPGEETRALVRGYAAGVNRYLRKIGGAEPRHRPGVPRPRLRPARRHRPRHLVRRLPRQPARLDRRLRAADRRTPRRRRPTDPGPAGAAGLGRFAAPPTDLPTKKALRAGLGKDPDAPFGSNATAVGSRRHDHRQGHGARQPALPVARPLPVHPAPAHHPRQVRRRRRRADRLAGGQHRLEQGRRLEPHRLDGVPVHAVRVQAGARQRHVVPHRGRADRADQRAP